MYVFSPLVSFHLVFIFFLGIDKVHCYASLFQPLAWSLIERPPAVSTYNMHIIISLSTRLKVFCYFIIIALFLIFKTKKILDSFKRRFFFRFVFDERLM